MDPMDWEPKVPGQFNTPMDWEPEIPGQFNTPIRVRRKRAAAEASLTDTADLPVVTATSSSISIVDNNFLLLIGEIFTITLRIVHQLYSSTIRGVTVTRRRAEGLTTTGHVEIRSRTADGTESVKRRSISPSGSPPTPTHQQLLRNKRLSLHKKPSRTPLRSTGSLRMTSSLGKRQEQPFKQPIQRVNTMAPQEELTSQIPPTSLNALPLPCSQADTPDSTILPSTQPAQMMARLVEPASQRATSSSSTLPKPWSQAEAPDSTILPSTQPAQMMARLVEPASQRATSSNTLPQLWSQPITLHSAITPSSSLSHGPIISEDISLDEVATLPPLEELTDTIRLNQTKKPVISDFLASLDLPGLRRTIGLEKLAEMRAASIVSAQNSSTATAEISRQVLSKEDSAAKNHMPLTVSTQSYADSEAWAAAIEASWTPKMYQRKPIHNNEDPPTSSYLPASNEPTIHATVSDNIMTQELLSGESSLEEAVKEEHGSGLVHEDSNLVHGSYQKQSKYPGILRRKRSSPSAATTELTNVSQAIPRPEARRARIALSPESGLPLVHKRRFHKDSRPCDWAPSSPLPEEFIEYIKNMSSLEANLAALETEELWLPRPSSVDTDNVPTHEDANTTKAAATPLMEVLTPLSSKSQRDISKNIIDRRPGPGSHENQITSRLPVAGSPFVTRVKDFWVNTWNRMTFSPSSTLPSRETGIEPDHEAGSPPSEMSDAFSPSNEPKSLTNKLPQSRKADVTHGTDTLSQELVIDNPLGDEMPGDFQEGIQDSKLSLSSEEAMKEYHPPPKDSRKSITRRDDHVSSQLGQKSEIEHAIAKLEISGSAKKKLDRKRRERDLAKAAKRAADEAAIAKAKAEAADAEQKARSNRRMPKERLVKPLSEVWEAKIYEAMDKGDHTALTTTATGTELRRRDFRTVLGEREWLNDEIINAYLEWVVEYANNKAGRSSRNSIPKVVMHNSFFYKNLATQGPRSVSRWMKRKKAEGKKLLEVETVLIPVNNASHWTIIVVSPKARTIEYLDSFAGPGVVFIDHTKAWLADELGPDWHESDWRVLKTRSAMQHNSYDCGVFTITNAECVTGGIVTDSYDWRDMTAQRRRVAAVLLNRGFGGELVPAEDLE